METGIKPEVIVAGASALCCLVPSLIFIARAVAKKRKKSEHFWNIGTIQGLEEAGWTPGQIKGFLKKHNIKGPHPDSWRIKK